MPTDALLLALASAGIHALWNLLLAGAEDVRTAAAIAGYTVLDRYGNAGIGALGSYALVVAALQHGSAAPVAAVRETSVVIAVARAALVLGERVGRVRWAGAVVVAAGTALVALG
mgnify:CR=1 FL=1